MPPMECSGERSLLPCERIEQRCATTSSRRSRSCPVSRAFDQRRLGRTPRKSMWRTNLTLLLHTNTRVSVVVRVKIGFMTHDYPLTFDRARELGLPVRNDMPENVPQLMQLYPRPIRRQPSVEYLPVRNAPRRARPQSGKYVFSKDLSSIALQPHLGRYAGNPAKCPACTFLAAAARPTSCISQTCSTESICWT
jgi:hypothetical protein